MVSANFYWVWCIIKNECIISVLFVYNWCIINKNSVFKRIISCAYRVIEPYY